MHASAALPTLDDMQDMQGDANMLLHCCRKDMNAICCPHTCISLFKRIRAIITFPPSSYIFAHLKYLRNVETRFDCPQKFLIVDF